MTPEAAIAAILESPPVLYLEGIPLAPEFAGMRNGRFWFIDGDSLHLMPESTPAVFGDGKGVTWKDAAGRVVGYLTRAADDDEIANDAAAVAWRPQDYAPRTTAGTWLAQMLEGV